MTLEMACAVTLGYMIVSAAIVWVFDKFRVENILFSDSPIASIIMLYAMMILATGILYHA